MSAATVDERGRLYLPKDVREAYGGRFRIVRLHDGIKLIPLSDDPVEGLREALEGLPSKPVEHLKAEAEAEAMEDALDDLR